MISRSVSCVNSPCCIRFSTWRTRSVPTTFVGLALVDQQPAVVGVDNLLRNDLFERRFEIDALDLVARHHHVIDRDRFEVEQVEQYAPVLAAAGIRLPARGCAAPRR
jgi:hypothetical protein